MGLTVVERVLSTPELLEAILLYLSLQDVLVNAQRVTQYWNRVIKSSPALLEHLFFVPAHDSPHHKPQWTKNPVLAKRFPAWFGDIRTTHRCHVIIDDYNNNPGPYELCDIFDTQDIKNSDWASCPIAYSRPEATWRRMLVMQPRITQLNVVYADLVRQRWRKTKVTGEFRSAEGLRMDYLYDFVTQEIGQAYTRFGTQWNMCDKEYYSGAIENKDHNNFVSNYALIERQDDNESMTLVFKCTHTDGHGAPIRWSENNLGADFRSRATNAIAESTVRWKISVIDPLGLSSPVAYLLWKQLVACTVHNSVINGP